MKLINRIYFILLILLISSSAIAANLEKWKYTSSKDKLTDNVSYFATLKSANKLYFSFPYSGGAYGNLILREQPSEDSIDVILAVSKGQFLTYHRTVLVRFDDNEPEKYDIGRASDGSSNLIFIETYLFDNSEISTDGNLLNNIHNKQIEKTNLFINKIKNAKRIRIKAEFYNEGSMVFEFVNSGLNWPLSTNK